MSHVTTFNGLMSARHGVFQAPSLRRQSRTAQLQIRLQSRSNLLTSEQTARAIETQLRRAKGGANAVSGDNGSSAASEQTTEGDLKARKQEAREWINAWQESQGPTQGSQPSSASREESQKVLAELRAINPLLTKEQEQAAMERLLNRGTQSVEEESSRNPESSQGVEDSSNGSAVSASQGGNFAPEETFEDGSVMYGAEALKAVDYESVLAP